MSPRAYLFPIDHGRAELSKRPGNTGNGRSQQKVDLAEERGEGRSDGRTCCKGSNDVHTAQGKSALNLSGYVWIELFEIFLEGCAVEFGKSPMLQRHQRFLGRAGRPYRVTTDRSQA